MVKSRIQSGISYLRSREIFGSRRGVVVLVAGAVALLALVVAIAMTLPRSVAFSYAGATCTRELTLFPQAYSQSDDAAFDVTFVDTVQVGSFTVASRGVCFKPLSPPEAGNAIVSLEMLGGRLVGQQFTLQVGESPGVDVAVLAQPVPTSRPLQIPLEAPDAIHEYVLRIKESAAVCEDSGSSLQCPVDSLKLEQGETYPYELAKRFTTEETEQTVADGTLTTLRAVRVTKASLKKDQTVYTKPKEFLVTFDKPVTEVSAELRSGDKTYKLTPAIQEKTAKLVYGGDDLPRDADYTLYVSQVHAVDGSGLARAYELPFRLSGGPRVASVNVGPSGVDPNAQIVLTLDQARDSKQIAADLVAVKGVTASVEATDTALVVNLRGGGRCQAFTIAVSKEIQSKYGVKASGDWSFQGRTRCHTVETLGYSVNGRAINAYIYGNGSQTYLFTGGIHGNELSSVYTTRSWMDELEANPGRIPGNARVVVIPSVNPDGVAIGSRDNARGVNLNRNFATSNWISNIETSSGIDKGGGGKSAQSEPEAKALANYTLRYRPKLVVTYHSLGSIVNTNDIGVSTAAGQRYASLAGYWHVRSTDTTATFGFEMTGTYEHWLYEQGIPVVLIELNNHTGNHIAQNRAAMWAMLGY